MPSSGSHVPAGGGADLGEGGKEEGHGGDGRQPVGEEAEEEERCRARHVRRQAHLRRGFQGFVGR